MVALTEGRQVLTWGIGSQGQLGRLPAFGPESEQQPGSETLFTPAPVSGVEELLGGSPVREIGAGLYNTFVVSAAGDVVAWGLNNSGQLGVAKADQDDNLVWAPVVVPGLTKV